MKWLHRILRTLIVVLAVVIAILWKTSHDRTKRLQQPLLNPPSYGEVGAFKLTDQNGRPFTDQDMKGQLWIVDFIFTSCPGPCPILTGKMKQLSDELKKTSTVKFLSFTVDPTNDTPPVLAKYARQFGADPARWTFLTGDKKAIYGLIRTSFQLAVEDVVPENPGDYDIVHSLHFIIVDREKRIRGYFNSNEAEAIEALKDTLRDVEKPEAR